MSLQEQKQKIFDILKMHKGDRYLAAQELEMPLNSLRDLINRDPMFARFKVEVSKTEMVPVKEAPQAKSQPQIEVSSPIQQVINILLSLMCKVTDISTVCTGSETIMKLLKCESDLQNKRQK